jgi:uncharacterized protein YbjQ (UPF0145 family)
LIRYYDKTPKGVLFYIFDKIYYMITTTTPSIENHQIDQYLGIVTGEVVVGANFVKDIFASVTDFLGGRSSTYEKVFQEARESALREMEQRAKLLGADAIVAVDIDYETIGAMLMVSVSGTAVKLNK